MDVAAVCFDVGGTLLHMDPPPDVLFAGLCGEVGLAITPEDAARAYERAAPWFNAHIELYRDAPEEFWFQGNRTLLESLGVSVDLDERAAYVTGRFGRYVNTWRVYPEVPEVLENLHGRGLPLGVISNWDPGLTHLLTEIGLGGAFAVILGSADVGVAKPDPRIFQMAADALAAPPARTLHVGDLYDYDVVGARAAGLIPVLVDRRGQMRASVFTADAGHAYDGFRIADLRGLLPLLDDAVTPAPGPR